MKSIVRGLSESMLSLSWSKEVALSTCKNGCADWKDRQGLTELSEKIGAVLLMIEDIKKKAKRLPELRQMVAGGKIRLNETGKQVLRACLDQADLDNEITILKVNPAVVGVTESGLKVSLKRAYIALD